MAVIATAIGIPLALVAPFNIDPTNRLTVNAAGVPSAPPRISIISKSRATNH